MSDAYVNDGFFVFIQTFDFSCNDHPLIVFNVSIKQKADTV